MRYGIWTATTPCGRAPGGTSSEMAALGSLTVPSAATIKVCRMFPGLVTSEALVVTR